MILKKILLVVSVLLFFIPFFAMAKNISNTQKPEKPFKILLIPGHDNEVWGAEYGNRKEADMNLVLATKIYNILKEDKRFKVFITRDGNGYTKDFSDYFSAYKEDIISFEKNAKEKMVGNITDGNFVRKKNAPHHRVSSNIALRLYGFNKWANENNIDAMVHIHFNDYPRANNWVIGKYKGFVMYIPDQQLSNYKGSESLAKKIFMELHKKYPISNFLPEKKGIVTDQQLIAIGANGTLDASVRSVLIEYGYIYEKIFRNNKTRSQFYKDAANLTVKGLENYFFGK